MSYTCTYLWCCYIIGINYQCILPFAYSANTLHVPDTVQIVTCTRNVITIPLSQGLSPFWIRKRVLPLWSKIRLLVFTVKLQFNHKIIFNVIFTPSTFALPLYSTRTKLWYINQHQYQHNLYSN